MIMLTDALKAQDKAYIANTYGRYDVAIEHGRGAVCFDYDGKRYLDFTSGIGVNALGFCNPAWAKAVKAQLGLVQHTSNLFYTAPDAALAEKLCGLTGYSKAFFCNSGAEANEVAIKAVRKAAFDRKGKGHSNIITLVNSFHGRTVTTLSATGQEHFHQYFYPFTEGFRYVRAGDCEALYEAADDTVCAVMLEFVQGEGGVVPVDSAFVRQVDELCRMRGMALIADEVQTGIGRTGRLLCSEHYGVRPHITTLAKGLGGGLPIGCALFDKDYSQVLGAGDHGSTFGGNPVVCAGAGAVLEKVADEAFLRGVDRKGRRIASQLRKVPEVAGVTGKGLMLGISLKTKQAGEVARACAQEGLLVLTAKEKVRLLPPLNITRGELDEGMEILCSVLNA